MKRTYTKQFFFRQDFQEVEKLQPHDCFKTETGFFLLKIRREMTTAFG